MHNQALLYDGEPILRTATVQAVAGEEIVVAGALGLVRARRAAGCLLRPERGDKVLVFLAPGESHVLSVLEKARQAGELALPQATTVQAASLTMRAGDVALQARAMRLQADHELELASGRVGLAARLFEVKASLVSLAGRALRQDFESLRTRAGRLLTQAGQSFGFFARVFERIGDVRETEAGRIRVQAEESVRVRARNTDVRAKESVVVDGKSIRIG